MSLYQKDTSSPSATTSTFAFFLVTKISLTPVITQAIKVFDPVKNSVFSHFAHSVANQVRRPKAPG